MSSQPRISIIIVSWNGRALLERCLISLGLHVQIPHEVIVVDNGSTDGTPAMVAERFPAVRVVRNQGNRGFSAANNQGLRLAKAEVVCFLNADTEVQNDPFPRLLSVLMDSPQNGAVGPRLVNADGSIQSSVRHWPRWADQVLTLLKLRHLLRQSAVFRRYHDNRIDHATSPIEVDEIMGAAILTRRSTMTQLGGWDEKYWIWFEDVDLCQRVHRAGLSVLYVPTSTILHHGGSAFATVRSLRKQWWYMRSLWRYARRYWSPLATVSLLIVFPVSYLLTIVQSLMKPR